MNFILFTEQYASRNDDPGLYPAIPNTNTFLGNTETQISFQKRHRIKKKKILYKLLPTSDELSVLVVASIGRLEQRYRPPKFAPHP